MANRVLNQAKSLEVNPVILSFNFAPNGSSAVDQTSIEGRGVASVARTDVGDFTITLDDNWPQVLGWSIGISHNADTDVVGQMAEKPDVSSGKTVKIRILAAATPTDIAAHANNRVSVTLFMRNSGVA